MPQCQTEGVQHRTGRDAAAGMLRTAVAGISEDRHVRSGQVRPYLVLPPGLRPRLDEERVAQPIEDRKRGGGPRARRRFLHARRATAAARRKAVLDPPAARRFPARARHDGVIDLPHLALRKLVRQRRIRALAPGEQHDARRVHVEAMMESEIGKAPQRANRVEQVGAPRVGRRVHDDASRLGHRDHIVVFVEDREVGGSLAAASGVSHAREVD